MKDGFPPVSIFQPPGSLPDGPLTRIQSHEARKAFSLFREIRAGLFLGALSLKGGRGKIGGGGAGGAYGMISFLALLAFGCQGSDPDVAPGKTLGRDGFLPPRPFRDVPFYPQRLRAGGKSLFGYVDSLGKIRIPPRFREAAAFSESLAPAAEVNDSAEALFGYIDSSGRWIIPARFRMARGFHEGLAVVSLDGKTYGFLYPDGQWAVAPRFTYLSDMEEGFAVAGFGPVGPPHRQALLDRSGRWRTRAEYGFLRYGGEGLLAARFGESCGYVDTTGKIRITARFAYCEPFREGLALVHPSHRQFDSVGFLDPLGNWAIPPRLGAFGEVREGLILFRKAPDESDTSWVFLDRSGRQAFAGDFAAARDFSEGLAPAEIRTEGGYLFGYLNRAGTWAILPRFDDAGTFRNGMAKVRIGYREGYIRRDGSWAWDPDDVRTGPIPPPRQPW